MLFNYQDSISATRAVFNRLVVETISSKTLSVSDSANIKALDISDSAQVKTLTVSDSANILYFANIPKLPHIPTLQEHIINKRYAETLVNHPVTYYHALGIAAESFYVKFSTLCNDILVIIPSTAIIPPGFVLSIIIPDISNQFAKFKILNTSPAEINIFSENNAVCFYSFFFNPSGSQPFVIPQFCHCDLSFGGGAWFPVIC